ncbi:MAG: DUF2905 domain-containing protein [Candidatus Sumerlaeia bacterium]
MRPLAITLIFIGVLFILAGGLVLLAAHFNIPLGRLPGDVNVRGRNWSFSFPIVTCIILSILLTLILNLFFRR